MDALQYRICKAERALESEVLQSSTLKQTLRSVLHDGQGLAGRVRAFAATAGLAQPAAAELEAACVPREDDPHPNAMVHRSVAWLLEHAVQAGRAFRESELAQQEARLVLLTADEAVRAAQDDAQLLVQQVGLLMAERLQLQTQQEELDGLRALCARQSRTAAAVESVLASVDDPAHAADGDRDSVADPACGDRSAAEQGATGLVRRAQRGADELLGLRSALKRERMRSKLLREGTVLLRQQIQKSTQRALNARGRPGTGGGSRAAASGGVGVDPVPVAAPVAGEDKENHSGRAGGGDCNAAAVAMPAVCPSADLASFPVPAPAPIQVPVPVVPVPAPIPAPVPMPVAPLGLPMPMPAQVPEPEPEPALVSKSAVLEPAQPGGGGTQRCGSSGGADPVQPPPCIHVRWPVHPTTRQVQIRGTPPRTHPPRTTPTPPRTHLTTHPPHHAPVACGCRTWVGTPGGWLSEAGGWCPLRCPHRAAGPGAPAQQQGIEHV